MDDEDLGKTILEIEVRGKRGVGYCKSMPGAVRPFERLKARFRPARLDGVPRAAKAPDIAAAPAEPWRTPGPADLIFPKWQRELFKTILDEETLRFDREGRPPNGLQPAAHLHLRAPDGGCRHLPDRQELPHQRRDDREILRGSHQDPA